MKKLRVGVIGTGSMGANHLRVYKKLLHLCDLIGVCDIDAPRCLRMQETHGIRCYSSPEELLSEVDAVSIVTPTTYHYEIAKVALEKGVHILLEKPMTSEPEQGRMLVRLAEGNGLVLQVGHIERFNPAVEILPNILQGKRIIALDFRRMSPYGLRAADVDVVQDLMIHDIDVMHFLLPEKVERIYANGASIRTQGKCDYAVAGLRLESGVIVNLTASRVTEQKIRKACISTEDAYVELDYSERKISVIRSTRGNYEGVTPSYRQESLVEKVFVPNHEPLAREIESFLNSAASGKKPLVDGDAGVWALETVRRIQESMTCAGAA